MEIIDFTNYKLSDRNLEYGGRAGEKRGIFINDEYWFLKFPKTTLGMSRGPVFLMSLHLYQNT